MRVDYSFICDYAETRDKVNDPGIGFDTIYSQQLPARHPHFHVVIQVSFQVSEVGEKNVRAHLIDADGRDLIPAINGRMTVNPPNPGMTESKARLNMGFGNVEFQHYGTYSISVSIGGEEVASIPLRVAEPPRTT